MTCNSNLESTSSRTKRGKHARLNDGGKRWGPILLPRNTHDSFVLVAQQEEVTAEKRAKRAEAYIAPAETAEPTVEEKRKRKREKESESGGDREKAKKKKKHKKVEELDSE